MVIQNETMIDKNHKQDEGAYEAIYPYLNQRCPHETICPYLVVMHLTVSLQGPHPAALWHLTRK